MPQEDNAIARHLAEACRLVPGGYSAYGSYVHASEYDPADIVASKGEGAILTDIEGRRYVDFDLDGGDLILGHADPRIVAAAHKAASRGLPSGLPSETETRLAEIIAGRIPGVDMSVFVNSHHDAESLACALACRATDRSHVLFLAREPGAAECAVDLRPCAEPFEPVPRFNELDQLRAFLAREGSRIAGVVIPGVSLADGLTAADEGYLRSAVEAIHTAGAVVILDETLTALRLNGGAAAQDGAEADLVLLGGCLAGGYALAAVCGKRHLMENAPHTALWQRLRPGGLHLAAATAVATLQALVEPEVYETMDRQAKQFAEQIRRSAAAHGFRARVTRVSSMLSITLHRGAADAEYDAAPAPDGEARMLYHRLRRALLEEGVLLPHGAHRPLFLSTAHTDDDMRSTAQALDRAFAALGETCSA